MHAVRNDLPKSTTASWNTRDKATGISQRPPGWRTKPCPYQVDGTVCPKSTMCEHLHFAEEDVERRQRRKHLDTIRMPRSPSGKSKEKGNPQLRNSANWDHTVPQTGWTWSSTPNFYNAPYPWWPCSDPAALWCYHRDSGYSSRKYFHNRRYE